MIGRLALAGQGFPGGDGDEGEARRIIAEDPYYTAPGVRVVALRGWSAFIGVLDD